MSEENELEYHDNLGFNQSIDNEIGEINIYGEELLPSYVLFELKKETYRIALTDFLEREFEELQELVFDRFPALIAYNYRLSVRGPGANDPVKKFLHLKDAWEGSINILNALSFGEIRTKGVDLKTANVFHSGNPNLHFNSKIILTDEPKQKLENIRAIVKFSTDNSLGLKIEQISLATLDYLYELQNNRNQFSHTATPTKEQAEEELEVVQPLFDNIIRELRFLSSINIVRFDSYTIKCRFEIFKGHYLNKEYEDISMTTSQLGVVMENPGEVIFAQWDDEIFSLSPFLHFLSDTTGHETYLCFYKGRKQSKYWYEPIKIRTEKTFDRLQPRFEAEKDAIIGLVVP